MKSKKSKIKATAQRKALLTKQVLSITEAAQLNQVTRQAIYVAIKLNKLKATKDDTRWTIHVNDLEEYSKNKYSRSKSMFNGELLFNNEAGYFSVNQVAEMLKVPPQKIYYATRIGKMKAHRRGAAWVIHADDVKEYQAKYIDRSNRLEAC